jgi:hypothetical protein
MFKYLQYSAILFSINFLLPSFILSFQDSLKFSTDTIDVKDSEFLKNYKTNTSFYNHNFEEIRSYPGVSEDVIKFFQKSPGVYFGYDLYNDLMIRGGSSSENTILIDGIEIPNANHYAVPGSSSGVFSMINLKMVKEVDFFAGGFPAVYGNKISGLIDIKFRNGNTKKHEQSINLSLAGFGGFFEGPLDINSSYLISIRRSYFEIFKENFKNYQLPNYWDINIKLNINLSENKSIEILGLGIIDNTKPLTEESFNHTSAHSENFNIAFKYLIRSKEHTVTNSLSFNSISSNIFLKRNSSNTPNFELFLNDIELNYKFHYKKKINSKFILDIISGTKIYFFYDKIDLADMISFTGFYIPFLKVNKNINALKIYNGINLYKNLSQKFRVNSGIRIDYFNIIQNKFAITPSIGISYLYNSKFSLNFSGGIYHQSPDIYLISANTNNKKLNYIKAAHIITGMEYLFLSDFRLLIEGYVKRYYDYPVSIYNPYFVYINQGSVIGGNIIDEAVSEGKGLIHGIDISLEKKLSHSGFNGGMNLSFIRSRFRTLAGPLQRTDYDFGKQLILNAGYIFKNGISIRMSARYSDGRPYTPFDIENSILHNSVKFFNDEYNNKRAPDYFRLDLRSEYKFKIFKSECVVYIEILNLLNRENIYMYGWNYNKLIPNPFYHFGRIPVLGINYKI